MLSSTNITKIAIAFRIYCQVTIWLFVIELLSWEYYYHRHKSTIEYDKETSSSSSSILSCPSAVMIDSCLVLSSIVFFFSLVSSIVFVTVIVLSLTLINSQKDNKSLWFLFFVMKTRKSKVPHDNVTFRAEEGALCFRRAGDELFWIVLLALNNFEHAGIYFSVQFPQFAFSDKNDIWCQIFWNIDLHLTSPRLLFNPTVVISLLNCCKLFLFLYWFFL